MAKRSTRISARGKDDEYTCMWGLFGVLRSCQVLTSSPKLISNGRTTNRHNRDHPRRLDQLNEECPDDGSKLDSAGVNGSSRSANEGHRRAKLDSELVDCLMKTQKDLLSEYFERSIRHGKYGQVDRISMQRVQMSAKAIADQVFIDSLIRKQGKNSKSNSSNLSEDLFMDLLHESNALLSRRRKDNHHSHIEKEIFKPVLDLDSKLLERMSLDGALAARKGKTDEINYQCSDFPRKSVVAQPPDEIVILKPAIRYTGRSENVTCHCSPALSHGPVSDAQRVSFSFRGMKKRLQHTFGGKKGKPSHFPRECASNDSISHGVDGRSSFNSSKTNGALQKKKGLNANRAPDIACVTDTSRKKLDFSGFGYSKKQGFDVSLEAKRHLSARLENVKDVQTARNEKSYRTLRRILASPERDLWPLSPGRQNQHCSCSAQMRFSPYNTSPGGPECNSRIPNGRMKGCLNPPRPNAEGTSCLNQSTDGEACETSFSATDSDSIYTETNPTPVLHNVEVLNEINTSGFTSTMEITDTYKLHKDDEIDSLSDLPSTPSSTCHLDLADSNKFQEYQSPVSVLEPLFAEDANSPQSTTLQTAQQPLQQLHLHFEESALKSFPHNNILINTSSSTELQDHLSEYVHSMLQASCLNWDQLSETQCTSEELLHASLFNEVQFRPGGCHFDPKLLFDLINEVLLSIHWSHFCFPSIKPKTISMPPQELVLDMIMTKAELHLLPWTEKITLDDVVSEDVTNCRSWLDIRLDTEHIVMDISENLLEECIMDTVLE